MENRRDFFKTLGAFAAGVIGAKVSSYIPKKEEKKEELIVSETITIQHEGNLYHPIVVAKTPSSSSIATNVNPNERMRISSDGTIGIRPQPEPKLRKLNS